MQGRRCSGAPTRQPGRESEIFNTEAADHADLIRGIERVGDHAVNLGSRDSGIEQRGGRSLSGKLQLTALVFLGESGLADARDRRMPPVTLCHVSSPQLTIGRKTGTA